MSREEKRGWMMVAGLFVVNMLIVGSGYFTAGVFFTPLLKQFGWSRAVLSTLTSILLVNSGLSAAPFGWLLDRIGARVLMVGGAALTGIAFLAASRITTFTELFACYFAIGIGVGACGLLSTSFVVANHFTRRRGLAMGVALAGTSTGGMVMTLIANHAIAIGGWRTGYIVLAIPVFVLAVPILLLILRPAPVLVEIPGAIPRARPVLEGMEVRDAVRTRSFWMISIAYFCFGYFAPGATLHLVPYLIGLGYPAAIAALTLSLVLGTSALGKLFMGFMADRMTGRRALAIDFFALGCGIGLFFFARHGAAIPLIVLVFGLSLGAPMALFPMVTVESFGLRRFGSIVGLTNLTYTVGTALGPTLSGRIFDKSASYVGAFEIFIALAAVATIAALLCRGLEAEQATLDLPIAPADTVKA